jgi:hypothetical protein
LEVVASVSEELDASIFRTEVANPERFSKVFLGLELLG